MSDELDQEFSALVEAAQSKIASFPDLPHKTRQFLLALVEFAPGALQRLFVCREIVECRDVPASEAMVELYTRKLIVRFGAAGCRILKVPEMSEENKNDVHARDGYRCVITGRPDRAHAVGDVVHPLGYATIYAVRIVPFSIGVGGETSSEIEEIIERFGGISLNELHGSDVDRSENVISLSTETRDFFSRLDIWLEPVQDLPNTYRFRTSHPCIMPYVPDGSTITLTAHSDAPLPDKRYFALHAACVQIMHAAGIEEEIEKIIEDWEDRTVLSSDGSSAKLLAHALDMVSAC